MKSKEVISTLACGVYLAALLNMAGCHKSEATGSASGGPHDSPMLTRVKKSQTGPQSAREQGNP